VRVDDSPALDFRITKNTGVPNDTVAKLAKINSKRNSAERVTRAQMSPSKQNALRTDSCSAFDE